MFGGYYGSASPDEIREMYRAWREHGIMPVAGGYLDQPDWWRHDMRTARAVFNVLAHDIVEDVKRRNDK